MQKKDIFPKLSEKMLELTSVPSDVKKFSGKTIEDIKKIDVKNFDIKILLPYRFSINSIMKKLNHLELEGRNPSKFLAKLEKKKIRIHRGIS